MKHQISAAFHPFTAPQIYIYIYIYVYNAHTHTHPSTTPPLRSVVLDSEAHLLLEPHPTLLVDSSFDRIVTGGNVLNFHTQHKHSYCTPTATTLQFACKLMVMPRSLIYSVRFKGGPFAAKSSESGVTVTRSNTPRKYALLCFFLRSL